MDQGAHFIEAGDAQGHVGAVLMVSHLAATSLPTLDAKSPSVVGPIILLEGNTGKPLHVIHGPEDFPQVSLFEIVLQGKGDFGTRPQGWFL